MAKENIVKPYYLMENEELLEILTKDRADYTNEMITNAEQELEKRGVSKSDIINRIKFNKNTNDEEELNLDDALQKISADLTPTDALNFTNYLENHLILQRTGNFSIFHLIEGSIYSYFGEKEEEEKIINEFLVNGSISTEQLENYKDWEAFLDSSSEEYIKKIAEYLDELEIPYFIKDLNMKFFFGFSSPFSIMIPVKYIGDAEEAVEKAQERAEELYQELEKAEEGNDEEKQIEIYDELGKLTPGDSAVFYNKAQILLNREDYENGASAYIESFNLDIENGQIDDIDETEEILNSLAEKLPENLDVRHSLATISSFRNNIDEALKRYQNILEINNEDAIAHLNLGHLYYTHTDKDEKAKHHFNKYLELEPNSIEAESVRSILENL